MNDKPTAPTSEDLVATVPYAVYKLEKDHQKRVNLTWLIIVITLVLAFVGTNVGWIIYKGQFETVTETIEEDYSYEVDQDADDGSNYFFGRDGEIRYGETKD